MIQKLFKENLGKFEGPFQQVKRKFQGCFMKFSRLSQGCFKNILKVSQRSFIVLPEQREDFCCNVVEVSRRKARVTGPPTRGGARIVT